MLKMELSGASVAADGGLEARTGAPLITARDVSVIFHGKTVLDRVSLTVNQGEILTIIGPNGAGKTTLARVLLGLVRAEGGIIERCANLKLGYVPQAFAVNPILPLTVRRFMTLSPGVSEAAAKSALEETGAAGLLSAQLSELSGGEFQRVLLARAIARMPNLLVLDEPARAVDFLGAAKLYDLINELRRTRGLGVLLISHDLHIVLGASDRVVCLNKHICCEGMPGTVAEHPEYMRLFGRDVARSFGLYRHHHDHAHSLHGDIVGGNTHQTSVHDCAHDRHS